MTTARRTLSQLLSDGLPVSRFNGQRIYIYAYVSPSGVIVYIGRTCDPSTRNGAHRAKAPWWTPDLEFALIDIAVGWEDAKAREAAAIREYAPMANIRHNARAAS